MEWPALMKIETAAAYTEHSESTIRRMIKAGEFPKPVSICGTRIRKSDIDAMINGLAPEFKPEEKPKPKGKPGPKRMAQQN